MPIQLDKILADISEEMPLHPHSEAAKSKKDQDEAWTKVGKKNKLSAHEAKSIFKVLQKKYEQEKLKPSSTWKLFQQMEDICRKQEVKPNIEEELHEQEDESMVEFLEVREEDDDYEGESDNQSKSMRSNNDSPQSSPDKETQHNVDIKPELKLLNSNMMVSQAQTPIKPEYNQQQQQKQTAFSRALQNKGISLRKTNPGPAMKQTTLTKTNTKPAQAERSMLLPDAIKRKLQNVERDEATPPVKKASIIQAQISNTPLSQTQVPEVEIKKEIMDDMDTLIDPNMTTNTAINVITIPPSNPNDLSNGMATFKPNGFNTQELDFQKDIIFDSNPGSSSAKNCSHATAGGGEIINLGNFDNHLPPTFFKNLCNSNRHEALGLYVANVMNRVTGKTAVKLELNILKAIIEAQSDEMERL